MLIDEILLGGCFGIVFFTLGFFCAMWCKEKPQPDEPKKLSLYEILQKRIAELRDYQYNKTEMRIRPGIGFRGVYVKETV